eukprot:CAMPEP_0174239518 /NCGR_PEP_ID=MMETSP0417-20130205/14990_1 /TAXON_ID=242541 /ORGANISM="Mayorella sp, Strain BSH-02190019" /LENGTH=707 /DNA_ID=CAMNT_0015318467 /DNA_START=134 /DNA_END=2257 /DNA_ORIENTATION=-
MGACTSPSPRYIGAGWKPLTSLQPQSQFKLNLDLNQEGIVRVLPPRDLSVPLTIFLRQRNLDELTALVHDVSHPRSPNYGRYLSQDELTDLISPSAESLDVVSAFLLKNGATSMELVANRDVMRVHLPLHRVEEIFSVRYTAFVAAHDAQHVIFRSAEHYRLPEQLLPHVDVVLGISDFTPTSVARMAMRSGRTLLEREEPRSLASGANFTVTAAGRGNSILRVTVTDAPANQAGEVVVTPLYLKRTPEVGVYSVSCPIDTKGSTCTISIQVEVPNYVPHSVSARFGTQVASYPYEVVVTTTVTPNLLRDLYKIPQGTRVTNPKVTQCVVEFEQQYYSPESLSYFLESMGLSGDVNVTVIGPNYPLKEGGEAALDIQWIMGMAPNAPTTFWSIAAKSSLEIDHILTWCYQALNMTDPPLINSLSYGMTETNVDLYLGKGYLSRTEVEFQKMAARGLTVIIADGDAGSVDLGLPPMSQRQCTPLHADWPSNSQYVTAIGSTYLTPYSLPLCYSEGLEECSGNPLGEVSVGVNYGMRWTTGGGFSQLISRPSWQAETVEKYLNAPDAKLPPSSIFNAEGRAYGDAVTCGHNLAVYMKNGGGWVNIDGTSASAPIFAAIATLLTEVSMNNGGPALGLMTPMMYEAAKANPAAFTDIVWGENNCGTTDFEPICCEHGFSSVPGFDAVSGLGSPNFAVLARMVTQAAHHSSK